MNAQNSFVIPSHICPKCNVRRTENEYKIGAIWFTYCDVCRNKYPKLRKAKEKPDVRIPTAVTRTRHPRT